jgi:hypothetical protein
MSYKSSNVTPNQDTGWGVIYRLNDLFREVESLAPSGKYDEWNIKLDRIFSNLAYRNPLNIVKDKDKNIISIEFDEDAYKVKLFFDEQILKHKKEMGDAKKKVHEGRDDTVNKDWVIAKKKLYKQILMKEIWLRKYMQELGLYLKEVEHNPAGAMWGK